MTEKIIAIVNNMKQIRLRMQAQPGKHDSVQVMHLNDAVDRIAEAMLVIAQKFEQDDRRV